MDIFSELTAGVKFRAKPEGRPPTSMQSTKEAPRETTSADPQEVANILRKRLRLHVRGSRVPGPIQTFEDLQLPQSLRKRLHVLGCTAPTAIQAQVIPLLLSHRDVIAISPTGSGKTLAFLLPLLVHHLSQRGKKGEHGVSSLILAPGRELAQQTLRVLQSLSEGLNISSSLVTGASVAGNNFEQVDVLVSTPLRLCRLLNPKHRKLDLSSLSHLVLDETDKLLEENSKQKKTSFLQQIDTIMADCTNPNLVISLYSATVPEAVERLARNVMKDPVRVTVGSRNATSHCVTQTLHFVGSEEGKSLLLQQLLQSGLRAPVLVFVSSKEKAVLLHRQLLGEGYRVDSMFSDQDYVSRQGALESFRAGVIWVLVSTDVLARGIDFVGVNTVISYDCPGSTSEYIHRIGRTGRAGQSGRAITFFTEDDTDVVRPIANLIAETGQDVPKWMLVKKSARVWKDKPRHKKQKETDNS